jgi:CheY-like chemotaxis protein
MKTIKLLYLEHDDIAIRRFERSLRNSEIHIDPSISREIDEAIQLLKINKYDLILTDVLWPDPDTGIENNKMFPGIIKKIRNENSRIPIIAFSEKGDAHIEVLKEEDEIYDIWSKSAGYPEFLPYRIKHFIYSWQNEMAEKALIEFVEIFLKGCRNAVEVSK